MKAMRWWQGNTYAHHGGLFRFMQQYQKDMVLSAGPSPCILVCESLQISRDIFSLDFWIRLS